MGRFASAGNAERFRGWGWASAGGDFVAARSSGWRSSVVKVHLSDRLTCGTLDDRARQTLAGGSQS